MPFICYLHSRCSLTDFPFFSSYSISRGSGNSFWYSPMLPADESPLMAFLHPLMRPQEEDNLFTTYLHPLKMLPAEHLNIHQQQQNQWYQNYSGKGFDTSQAKFYDSAMQTY
jgi:hypothetical protein